ncbi:MAG: class I SAM-dependent methyltransferase [Thiothrix sp.]|uniref:class I SAM-dependent methyltransferase n=1 Tax=Thiothrix sp. TaxID=1032 RepID=UPI0026323346|nr:class I SAM-dependent methyltransferase [Thiothrix sp.]MDD5392913.1 class I SAM-dependent methyltransferase [Thiothrix sp.]
MTEYHKYVFDSSNRRFVGKFEEMYQQEKIVNFDSWHQDDSRQLNRKIALEILSGYNFGKIIDIGTGKGTLTHQLKKFNNHVLGLDISPTAIEVARARFPDIEFDVADVNDLPWLTLYLDNKYGGNAQARGADLVFTAECLSYIEHWKELICELANRTRYLMINLFIPPNPIGFVKSIEELEAEVSLHFEILELVVIKRSRFVVLFAQSR